MSRSTSKATRTGAHRNFLTGINLSRPHGTLSRDGKYKWSAGWQTWVPVPQQEQEISVSGPLESGPLLLERHSESCVCAKCMTAGQHYADFLKARSTWPR